MAVPLLLLNLPFLLLFLLVLCGRKKKKSNEGTPPTPVKTSTASKTSKEPQKPKDPPKEASPSASTSNSKAADKSKTSTSHNGNSNSNVEKSIKEEETQETSEEREIKLANVIISRHKELKAGIITVEMEQEARERECHMSNWRRGVLNQRIGKLFSPAYKAYKMHKCTHPKKKRTEDERCDVCKAYFEFAALIYDKHNDEQYGGCNYTVSGIIANYFYDYGGKLPLFLENPEWQKRKNQLKKDMEGEMKLEPIGTNEERHAKIKAGSKKLYQIIKGVDDYWHSPDDEFRQRIAKDYEETRQIYRKHDCRGIPYSVEKVGKTTKMRGYVPPKRRWMPYSCSICEWYVESWTERLYEIILKNEKRSPVGMKEQLEEDFFLYQQKFGQEGFPKILENPDWSRTKEWIAEERAKEEKEKKEEKAQTEGK